MLLVVIAQLYKASLQLQGHKAWSQKHKALQSSHWASGTLNQGWLAERENTVW